MESRRRDLSPQVLLPIDRRRGAGAAAMRDRALLLRLSLSASSAAAAAAEALAWHLLPIFVAAVVSAIYDTNALQPSLWAAAAALGIFALAARQYLRHLHRNVLLAALHRVCTTHEGRAACARARRTLASTCRRPRPPPSSSPRRRPPSSDTRRAPASRCSRSAARRGEQRARGSRRAGHLDVPLADESAELWRRARGSTMPIAARGGRYLRAGGAAGSAATRSRAGWDARGRDDRPVLCRRARGDETAATRRSRRPPAPPAPARRRPRASPASYAARRRDAASAPHLPPRCHALGDALAHDELRRPLAGRATDEERGWRRAARDEEEAPSSQPSSPEAPAAAKPLRAPRTAARAAAGAALVAMTLGNGIGAGGARRRAGRRRRRPVRLRLLARGSLRRGGRGAASSCRRRFDRLHRRPRPPGC